MKRAIGLAVLASLLFGCPRRPPRQEIVSYRTADTAGLLASYNENANSISTLSADLAMTFFYMDENNRARSRRLSAWLDVEKPGKLRLKHDAIGRDMFYIVSDGSRFWMGLDAALGEEDVVYKGDFKSLSGESFLRPDRLLAAFSLAPLPPAGTADTVLEAYKDTYVLAFIDASEPRQVLARAHFSRVDLRLSRYQTFDADSRLVLDVEYRSYAEIGGSAVPSIVLIDWPLDGFSTLARTSRVSVGRQLPPKLWEFNWRPGTREVDLSENR